MILIYYTLFRHQMLNQTQHRSPNNYICTIRDASACNNQVYGRTYFLWHNGQFHADDASKDNVHCRRILCGQRERIFKSRLFSSARTRWAYFSYKSMLPLLFQASKLSFEYHIKDDEYATSYLTPTDIVSNLCFNTGCAFLIMIEIESALYRLLAECQTSHAISWSLLYYG